MQNAHRNDEMEIVGPMTAKEYFAEALRASDKPRDARKAELIDGVLILFPSPLDVHERLYVFLLRLLGEYAERFDLGEVRGSRSRSSLPRTRSTSRMSFSSPGIGSLSSSGRGSSGVPIW